MAFPMVLIAIGLLVTVSNTAANAQQYGYGAPSETVNEVDANGNIIRTRGIRDRSDKDFVLGGFFPVHFDDPNSGGSQCGPARGEGGLESAEAMLYALDVINNNPDLLPNLVVGYDIRDTCYIESIALEEALDLVIIGTERAVDACECEVYPSGINASQQLIPTLGMVGAAASRVSIPIASLGRLFEVPQISYASTSFLLSIRDRYTYFYRTITPDNIQARAIIALMVEFGWNHISIIYSSNAYGTPARDEIVALAEQTNICVDLDQGIADDFSEGDYEALAWSLNGTNAEVVILFASQLNAELLLNEFTNITNHRRLTWIASEAWSQALTIISHFNDTLVGLFGTRPRTRHVDGFQEYFSRLTIDNNNRDPWFPEFFSTFTGCNLNSTCNSSASIVDVHDYQQEYTIPRVIEAVYVFAHALQDYLDDNCDQPLEWNRANYSCKGQKRALSGSTVLEYIANVSFVSPVRNTIEFNDLGYVTNDSYEIFNYQAVDNQAGMRSYEHKMIGFWEPGSSKNNSNYLGVILFIEDQLQYRVNEAGDIVREPHIPQCGHCTVGQYLEPGFSSCCGSCSNCLGQKYSNESSATTCTTCNEYMWGNDPTRGSSHCIDIEETSLSFSHPWAIIMVILSLLGLLSVGVVTVFYGLYWKTPVIKSSGREQMILLLIGISLSYMLAFIYVSPPVLTVCVIQRIGLWFCFSLMFGALMVKIIRVAYIFIQGTKSVKPPRFQQPKYLLLFTSFIVIVQMLLVLVSVLIQYPEVLRSIRFNQGDNNNFPKVIVSCNRDHLALTILSLLYEAAVIVVATVFGIISFKYPKNFNEAKHVSLCTFALAVIWLAFIPSYFATESLQEFQNAAISLAVIMSASAVLVCMFVPRIYIIIVNPDQNTSNMDEYVTNIPTPCTISGNTPTIDKGRKDAAEGNGCSIRMIEVGESRDRKAAGEYIIMSSLDFVVSQ